MRKQIAAANWKMNLSYQEGEQLLKDVMTSDVTLAEHHQVIFAVPHPYLVMAQNAVSEKRGFYAAAQNCSQHEKGAYTGEVSAPMLQSVGVEYCIVGHSERREYFREDNATLAQKLNLCFQVGITPIFCCGEPLEVRDREKQNEFVAQQLQESLFHLEDAQASQLVIAYEPIWAIGTGRTASAAQAQEMHAFIRSVLAAQWSEEVAGKVSILYGGSVKGANAQEIFANEDVDGGLVGGASLQAAEFVQIIKALKH